MPSVLDSVMVVCFCPQNGHGFSVSFFVVQPSLDIFTLHGRHKTGGDHSCKRTGEQCCRSRRLASLLFHQQLVHGYLKVSGHLHQLANAGAVDAALPLANCAVAQACYLFQIGAAQSVQLAKLVNF
nr:MAG TPA: hypothetical protein [Caudoviricetes sp.]